MMSNSFFYKVYIDHYVGLVKSWCLPYNPEIMGEDQSSYIPGALCLSPPG